jgi:hypothetical protein
MSQIESIALPLAADGDFPKQVRHGADFDARWAAWQLRGRAHERVVRRKVFMVVPAAVAAAAIVYAVLIW